MGARTPAGDGPCRVDHDRQMARARLRGFGQAPGPIWQVIQALRGKALLQRDDGLCRGAVLPERVRG